MTQQTDRLNTALAGRYRIERHLGEGGMASVYLCEDLRHKRKVALKLLKPELAAVLGADRFVQEITTTASLQHPHILPLFDSGTADGFLFYVMPLVEGETLREKLNRETQLGVDEAVRIAREVLDALQYAHEHGIVHRDVKPENILLHGGHAMVADFGIALAVSAAAGGRMTETGLSLGTPHYMSPEQATAEKEITARSDVYSLGSVLYEMLTGEPPHMGNAAQQIIMKIITEPAKPVTALRKSVPPNVSAAVAKSLEKLPADRFESAKAFSDALGNSAFTSATSSTDASATAMRSRSVRRDAALVLAGGAIVGAMALFFAMRARSAGDPPLTTRFVSSANNALDAGVYSGYFSVSPDGRTIVVPMASNRQTQLYARSLEDPQLRPLAGSEGATGQSCFSSDGQSIAFFGSGKLSRIPTSGGTPTVVATRASLGSASTCAWNGDVIVLGGRATALRRVAAAGGPVEAFTQLDAKVGEVSQVSPTFLSDGRTVAFSSSRSEGQFIAFATMDGNVTRTKQRGTMLQQLHGDLAVIATEERTLIAVQFDPSSLSFGRSVPVLDNVFVGSAGAVGWSASPNGTLVYSQGGAASSLMLVSREGRAEQLGKEARPFLNPRVSPDGKRIAANVTVGDRRMSDIWIYTLGSGTLSPFTTGGGFSNPIWSRDGARIAFSITRTSATGQRIAWHKSDGGGDDETIVDGIGSRFPFGWSADGRTLIYDESSLSNSSGMQVVARTLGDSAVRRLASWAPTSRLPSISPDGRWVAYASDVSSRYEVYVSPFPGPGGHWQVSTDFGDQPLWAHNGHELFYRDRDSIVVATVKTSPAFEVVARRKLFADVYSRNNTGNWDVMPDDQHFVMLKPEPVVGQFTVVANWLPELRAKLGIK